MSSKPKSALVVYYSRTHHSQKLADAIALKLGANTYEIEADQYYLPIIGYLRAGLNSVRGKLPLLTKPVPDFSDYDCVLICGPVWTSYPALPIRAFLRQYGPDLPKDVALFLTGRFSEPAFKAIDMATEILGRPLKTAMSISNEEQNEQGTEHKVAAFCEAVCETAVQQAHA